MRDLRYWHRELYRDKVCVYTGTDYKQKAERFRMCCLVNGLMEIIHNAGRSETSINNIDQ